MTVEMYLSLIKSIISNKIIELNNKLKDCFVDRKGTMRYVWENISSIDNAEMTYWDTEIYSKDVETTRNINEIKQLQKAFKSPFFGKMTISIGSNDDKDTYYIGLRGLHDDFTFSTLILDWRAPIASLFYEGDIGECNYQSPSGIITVLLKEKKQILIRDGTLETIVDISDPVHDTLLLNYLEQNATLEMKTIVASLQKEQNHLIRMNTNASVFLLGPAGSGKTAIALHRAAFLLYKNEFLKAEQIVFISHKKYLYQYISCVLPNLDEDNINIFSYDELFSNSEYGAKLESNAPLLSINQQYEIISSIIDFESYLKEKCIQFNDIKFNEVIISQTEISKLFNMTFRDIPFFSRLPFIQKELTEQYGVIFQGEEKALFLAHINKELMNMIRTYDITQVYHDFISFIKISRNIELHDIYSDIFLLLKNHLYEKICDVNIRYAIVDEMQDLNLFQHAVINAYINCPFLVVGDINQSEQYTENDMGYICKLYNEKSEIIRLFNCYRSTFEIAEFSKYLIQDFSINSIDRHGDPIQWCISKNTRTENENLIKLLLKESDLKRWNTIAIIVSNYNTCKNLVDLFRAETNLSVAENSIEINNDLYIYELSKVKGLEFDCVFIYDTNTICNDNFGVNRLYIAATRALHKLVLFSTEDNSCEDKIVESLLNNDKINIIKEDMI